MDNKDNKAQEMYKKTYESNLALLENYGHINKNFPKFEELDLKPISCDKTEVTYFSTSKDEIYRVTNTPREIDNSEIYFLRNETNIFNLMDIEKRSRDTEQHYLISVEPKRPLYLYFDSRDYFFIFCFIDIKSLIENNRTVFFFGENEMREFLSDPFCAMPSVCGDEWVAETVKDLRSKRRAKAEEALLSIKEYYAENSGQIIENIKNKKARVLFLTTRFGAAVSKYTAHLMNDFAAQGYETKLFMEKSPIHLNRYIYFAIDEFKPDIIVEINKFRYDYELLPPEIVFVTWNQDPNAIKTMGERDFILTHTGVSNDDAKEAFFKNCKDKLTDCVIRCNNNIYKRYALSSIEKSNYQADICMVVMSLNPWSFFRWHLRHFLNENKLKLEAKEQNKIQYAIKDLLDYYYESEYNERKLYFSFEEHEELLKERLDYYMGANGYSNELLSTLVKVYSQFFASQMYRHVVMKWIIDGGFESLKIWSFDGYSVPEFAKYDCGVAQNGVMLSKIYNASKLTVGNTLYSVSGAGRLYESALGGCLYLANTIPRKESHSHIENLFKEDELVYYTGKEDLINKLRYYLENENERQAQLERTKRRILRDFTSYEKPIKELFKNMSAQL